MNVQRSDIHRICWLAVRILVLTAFFLVRFSAPGQEKLDVGTIKGQVCDRHTNERIPFANVSIVGGKLGAVTTVEGEFLIANIPAGSYEVQISHIGFSTKIAGGVVVQPGKATSVVIQLDEKEVHLPEVHVSAKSPASEKDMPVSMQYKTSREILSTPGSLDDVARSISTLPGVGPTSFERNDLIVRGGAPSENLLIVDNIVVPTISHFSTQGSGGGSSSIINMDLVDYLTFSSGGFGVRNGDKISSVLNLGLREGSREERATKATLSATQYGIVTEGPVGSRASYLLSARKSYLDLVFKAYDMSFAPDYADVLGKLNWVPGASDRIELLTIGKLDRIKTFNDTEIHRLANSDLVLGNQSLFIAGATWKHISQNSFTLVTLANVYSEDDFSQRTPDGSRTFDCSTFQNRTALNIDLVANVTATTEICAGGGGELIKFDSHLTDLLLPWYYSSSQNSPPIARNIDTLWMKGSAYVQVSQTIGDLLIHCGIRLDYLSFSSSPTELSPRVSMTYHLFPATSVTVSLGQYYQSPALIWMANPYNRNLDHTLANQLVGGITHHPSEFWTLRFEGYHKNYFQYPISIEVPFFTVFNAGAGGLDVKDFGIDSLISSGTGESEGMELLVQRNYSDFPVSGILSVSFSQSNFMPYDGIRRPADHDQKWIVNIALDYRVSKAWELSAKFRMYTGHPYTYPDLLYGNSLEALSAGYNASRVGFNHLLDMRITRRWTYAGLPFEGFLDVQNVYSRKVLDTPLINPRTGQLVPWSSIGIIPSIGFAVTF